MLVLLVRHGHAGTKRHRRRDDGRRPLNRQGFAEAAALSRLLAPYAPARIVSSPLLRCTQTVTPLATVFGLPVEESADLLPAAGAAARLLALAISVHGAASGTVVVCTHGEVIHDLQLHLGEDGPSSFDADSPREKGSVWVLEREGGRFLGATYLPPPPVVKR
jgi:phosphohistidine phosphatase SixA